MKELIPFMVEHPIVSLLMLLVLCQAVLQLTFRPWNRLMRHLNIRKAGWPPPHCDADGDPTVKAREPDNDDDTYPGMP